jgi:hypothetical protein
MQGRHLNRLDRGKRSLIATNVLSNGLPKHFSNWIGVLSDPDTSHDALTVRNCQEFLKICLVEIE